jgi:hypothetical protein
LPSNRFRIRRIVAAAVALTVGAPLVLAVPAAHAETTTTQTPVMGPNLVTADQLALWYSYKTKKMGITPNLPTVGNDVRRLASIFIAEGRIDGVRGDMAFMQSILETGWFTFPDYGQIRPDFNNFAGLNAFDGRPKGTTCAEETAPSRCYDTPELGVRNQIQLLRGYADKTVASMADRLRKPPADRIGAAPIWELFGGQSGKAIWATAPYYGLRVIALYSDALVFLGARAECLPYSPTGASNPSGSGYWEVTADGSVYPIGSAVRYGDVKSLQLNKPLIGGEATRGGKGYWLLGLDGGVFSFGNAAFHGSMGAAHLNAPVNGMERTATSAGYWLVAYDGGIFSFGDAKFFGSTGAMRLNKPVFGMERTASGAGYWLFALDGGIFSFGDAKFYGSLGAKPPKDPVVSMQRTADGKGYWMLDSTGHVYAFGNAVKYGDVGGCNNFKGAARMLVTPTGKGYWILTLDGAIVPFGDARRLGSPPTIGGAPVALMLHK